MTTPIELPPLDLRTAILARLRPITATVHVDLLDATRQSPARTRQLAAALRTGVLAMTKNLEPAGLSIDDGDHDWTLGREPHGDGWILSGVWRPRA